MRITHSLLFLAVSASTLLAQRQSESARGGTSAQVQPKIMVIPYTKQGEDILTVLEADFNRRVALTKVKEGFDNRGFSTVDFAAVVKGLNKDELMQSTSQSDIKSMIVAQARCDVYVEVEVNAMKEGNNQRVAMIMSSYLAANAASLANKTANEGPFQLNVPLERIVERAVTNSLDAFLASMQSSFDGFVTGGVPIRMEINVAKGAKNLARPVGPNKDELADVIEEWLEKNAYQNNYHISGRTPLTMKVDEVRIPLFDPGTQNNFNPSRFSLEFVRYLRTLDVRASRSLAGGIIYVEIQ